jgi:hypothetical protein
MCRVADPKRTETATLRADFMLRALARRRAQGATLDELARSYNVGISTIRRTLFLHGKRSEHFTAI